MIVKHSVALESIYGCDVDGVELRSESRRFSRLLVLACTTVTYSKVDR